MSELSELTEINQSLQNIEKILTKYCEAQSMPTGFVSIERKMSRRKFRKLKSKWIKENT